MLEYCLEDGEQLSVVSNEIKTVQSIKPKNKKTEAETVSFDNKNLDTEKVADAVKTDSPNHLNEKAENLKQKATQHWLKFLEYASITFALSHNYWQWLYFEKKRLTTIGDFLISGVFLFWLLLLFLGLIFSILSLQFSKNREFAIVALIVLAINLLLSIVPK